MHHDPFIIICVCVCVWLYAGENSTYEQARRYIYEQVVVCVRAYECHGVCIRICKSTDHLTE